MTATQVKVPPPLKGVNGASGDRGEGPGPRSPGGAFPLPRAQLGLWLFLAVATILFSAVISAYVVRMGMSDWQPLPEPALLWVNTGVLVLSSAALQWARRRARRCPLEGVRPGLILGGGLALAFFVGQLWAWQQLHAGGYFLAANPSSSFFYLITALHGAHLGGGLVTWGRTTVRVWRGVDGARARLSVSLCAVYWHFLLVVWLVLFGLMLFT